MAPAAPHDPWRQTILPDDQIRSDAVALKRGPAAGVVFASTVGNALSVTPTVGTVFGLVLVPIAVEFHWSRAGVSGASATLSVATALAYPLAGWLGDKFGARRIVLLGSLALGMSVLSLGFAGADLTLFYIQFALIGIAGAIQSSMLYAKLLADWFDTRRGAWMGLSSGVGNGLGVTIMPMIAAVTLVHGWRITFVTMALLILVVGLPIQVALIRERPSHTGMGNRDAAASLVAGSHEGFTTKRALRSKNLWLMVSSLPVGGGCLLAAAAAVVPLLTDRGLSVQSAAEVVAACGLSATILEPTVGCLLDYTSRPRMLSVFYLASIPGILLVLGARGELLLLLGGALIGAGLAAEFSAISFLLSRYFGRKALGMISGLVFGILLAVNAVVTVILNMAYDASHSYHTAFLWLIPFLVWNGLIPLWLPRYTFEASDHGA